MTFRVKLPCLAGALAAALTLAACNGAPTNSLNGYVDADHLYLSPQDAGVVLTLDVVEGDRVSKGDPIFSLDPARFRDAADQANAVTTSAAARADDAGAMAQRIAEAAAALKLAVQTHRRAQDLVKYDAVSKENLDRAIADLSAAKARYEQARAERGAGSAELSAARAAQALADRRLVDLSVAAPAAGSIERIYRRPGEVVGAGEPVVALLTPENIKLRFFAPQAMLPAFRLGDMITFTCDGCDSAREARISFIATEPQFTPPVIYSVKEREKLVFLIEARPIESGGLRPGLPVTLILP